MLDVCDMEKVESAIEGFSRIANACELNLYEAWKAASSYALACKAAMIANANDQDKVIEILERDEPRLEESPE